MKDISKNEELKRNLQSDRMFFSLAIFFVGSFLTMLFNYFYHLLMGRMLGPIEYGILATLFSIIYITTFSTTAFNYTLSRFSSELHTNDSNEKLNSLVSNIFRKIIYYGFVFLLVYLSFTPVIAWFMHLESITGLFIVGIISYLSFISAILTGILNGLQKFFWQNLSHVVSTLIKLIFAVVLVYIGLRSNGALMAIAIGSFVSILLIAYPLKSFILSSKNTSQYSLKQVYGYLVPVLLINIFLIMFITVDQILVKHFFSSYDAGLYAAAGMIAKIIWFSSGFLIGPFFPKIVSLNSKKKSCINLMQKSLTLIIILSCAITLTYLLFPDLIVSMLYGDPYTPIIPLIGIFAISISIFTINQLFVIYDLAIEKVNVLYILLFGIILEIFLIIFFHQTLYTVLFTTIITNTMCLLMLLIYNREIFSRKKLYHSISNNSSS